MECVLVASTRRVVSCCAASRTHRDEVSHRWEQHNKDVSNEGYASVSNDREHHLSVKHFYVEDQFELRALLFVLHCVLIMDIVLSSSKNDGLCKGVGNSEVLSLNLSGETLTQYKILRVIKVHVRWPPKPVWRSWSSWWFLYWRHLREGRCKPQEVCSCDVRQWRHPCELYQQLVARTASSRVVAFDHKQWWTLCRWHIEMCVIASDPPLKWVTPVSKSLLSVFFASGGFGADCIWVLCWQRISRFAASSSNRQWALHWRCLRDGG